MALQRCRRPSTLLTGQCVRRAHVIHILTSLTSHQGSLVFRRFLFFAKDFPTIVLPSAENGKNSLPPPLLKISAGQIRSTEKEPRCAYHEYHFVGKRFVI